MKQQAGKIGIFDSGLGGLTILKEIVRLMPDRNYIYLGDNANAPYGDKSQEEIFKLTLSGVEWLFEQGAVIVILACNTASANALRKIQQDILPMQYPGRRVLGIIIPTVEDMGTFTKSGNVGVLATKATVASKVFEIEIKKNNPKINIISESGGKLASLIEADAKRDVLLSEIKKVTTNLLAKNKLIDTVILGCTHYPLIMTEIKEVLPGNVNIISQGSIIATKLENYLNKHNEIRNELSDQFSLKIFTTSKDEKVKRLMIRFFGKDVSISSACL